MNNDIEFTELIYGLCMKVSELISITVTNAETKSSKNLEQEVILADPIQV